MRKNISRQALINKIHEILPLVQKPGRYIGGEFNQIVKDWDLVDTKIALIFPDIYEIGLSNLGLAILYDLINNRNDALAERVYSVWVDMEKIMRAKKIPLFSLESMRPLVDFDILGFSIPYESLYTNVLNVLDLGGLPLFSIERDERYPLVIAGGNATFNPEPMYQFIDAFVIGDGENIINLIIDTYKNWKQSGRTKEFLLHALSKLDGVYVPIYYEVEYYPDSTIQTFRPKNVGVPVTIKRNLVKQLLPSPKKFLVPNIDTTHNRISIEIMRGCTHGCRFCQAGMINRPIRERPVKEIVESVGLALKSTGFEEISLLSLSSSDYTKLPELISELTQEFYGQNLTISLPSLRIDTFSVEMMDRLQGNRRGSFTFAPEAASDSMRNRINKIITSEQLFAVAREVFRHGWSTIKLYFMIGLPGETIEDIQSIADLCLNVLKIGIEEVGFRVSLNININDFIPKPHTPFQWVPQDEKDLFIEKQNLLKKRLKNKNIKLNWSNNDNAILEACLSRGDRKISNVILDAWKNGAKFDAWHDQFNWQIWMNALNKNKINPSFYTNRKRNEKEILPWDFIDTGVSKNILFQEYQYSINQKITPDCRERCYGCGIQAKYKISCFNNQPVPGKN